MRVGLDAVALSGVPLYFFAQYLR
ncbi:hypothetical protein EMEDMD4_240006 [Sinorhizobium medicae]|uniref:Uncharacterized protein n=1 Tax=Sinorhizobium medicae TaxID=110321 RepID=A0A508WZE9_9HYPH|nr:hypothetical protein EMEDMD4_240006 [Sinorhizobium medicae]